jgi:hypothetical protein
LVPQKPDGLAIVRKLRMNDEADAGKIGGVAAHDRAIRWPT